MSSGTPSYEVSSNALATSPDQDDLPVIVNGSAPMSQAQRTALLLVADANIRGGQHVSLLADRQQEQARRSIIDDWTKWVKTEGWESTARSIHAETLYQRRMNYSSSPRVPKSVSESFVRRNKAQESDYYAAMCASNDLISTAELMISHAGHDHNYRAPIDTARLVEWTAPAGYDNPSQLFLRLVASCVGPATDQTKARATKLAARQANLIGRCEGVKLKEN